MNKNSKLDVVHGTWRAQWMLGAVISTTATTAITIITVTAMFISYCRHRFNFLKYNFLVCWFIDFWEFDKSW